MRINGVELGKNCMSNMVGKQVYREFVYVNPRSFSFEEIREGVREKKGLSHYYDFNTSLRDKIKEDVGEGILILKRVEKENRYYPKSLESSIK